MNELTLIPGMKEVKYGSDENYYLLAKNDNIGINGENLTIITLSCNRPNVTIKQINTIKEKIPNFKGKYIIGDNGSTKETIEELKQALTVLPFESKLVEFGQNLGATKGRNKLVEMVETQWFMVIDNDIYFTTNILPEINKTIYEFGAHFVNIPLMDYTKKKCYSLGGGIILTKIENGYHVEGKSMFNLKTDIPIENIQIPRSISNFLYASAVMKKETFLACGGFDENMFIGFEDLDFSITIFNKGYKIATAGIIGAVHHHEKPITDSDIEYEKARFSNKNLLNSAVYFEKKHGLKVWSQDVEQLIEDVKNDLNLDEI